MENSLHLKAPAVSGMKVQRSCLSSEVMFRKNAIFVSPPPPPSGGRYNNLKTYGLAHELFEICIESRDGDKGLNISDIRIVNRSDGKGCTYNLGRYCAASVTNIRDKKGGEKVLGFLHGGMYITGSGLNGLQSCKMTQICEFGTKIFQLLSVKGEGGVPPNSVTLFLTKKHVVIGQKHYF